MTKQIAGRLFAISLMFYVYASSIWSVDSLIYALTRIGREPARMTMLVLAVFAFLLLLDTLINDIMPARFTWKYGVRCRQALWLWTAVIYCGLAWVSHHFNSGVWLAGYYMLCCFHCIAVAVIDLWYEHRSNVRARRSGDVVVLYGVPVLNRQGHRRA